MGRTRWEQRRLTGVNRRAVKDPRAGAKGRYELKSLWFLSRTLVGLLVLTVATAGVTKAFGADGKRIDHLKRAVQRADSLYAADKLVGWNTDSIVGGIRDLASLR